MPQARAIIPDQGGISAGLNTTGTTIPNHRIVRRGPTTDSILPAVDGLDGYVGVTLAVILAGQAGDVQIERRAIVEAGGAIPIGSKIMGGTGGKAAVAVATRYSLGIANTEALVDGDLIEVDIDRSSVPA